jgi:hypothetical protein
MLLSDRNLYLTADRLRVVEEDDTDQRSLLVGKGCELDRAAAERYGIEPDEDGRLVVVEVKEAEPGEDKQAEASENKAVIPPENKRRKARRKR